MEPAFNQSVLTPLGKGTFSGCMKNGPHTSYLVRLPVNDQTKEHLRDWNCVTPRAQLSGLWRFQKGELQ